jgi:2-succinyl-5-enolpyruvyl-6-hydroxy-3-cyclohexene-1-carboxylate synthase
MQQHVYSLATTCSLMGVKHVVMSPGSRSAPLVFAFARNRKFALHTFIDERSAAYAALGMAQQTQRPVVLFCTSGTAAANYYPAVCEAFYQQIPLIVITADRPQELLHQQDGQMINQQHLFGHHVRAFYQFPCYEHGKENHRQTVKTTAEALAHATSPVKGPVHINIPFSEPLYPAREQARNPGISEQEAAEWLRSHIHNDEAGTSSQVFSELEYAWVNCSKKMLLVGQGMMHEKWITPLLKLQDQQQVVILTDVVSNKHPFNTTSHFDKLISGASTRMLKELEPELLVSVGGPLLSKSLKNWLRKVQPEYHFRIQTQPERIDTYGNLTHVITAKAEHALVQLAEIRWNKEEENPYVNTWKAAGDKAAKKVGAFLEKDTWSELHATRIILDHLPQACNLQLANSSIVRYASLCGNMDHSFMVNSNRGTSGIDGCTSTAVGAALVNKRPTVLLTGDLAFLYDKNGLWMDDLPDNLRIIVFNNNGGGIFTLIDGPTSNTAFSRFFTTPMPQQIKAQAQQNGLDYYFCKSQAALKKTLAAFFNPSNKASLLELQFDMDKNARVFKQFKNIKF